jgi:peptide deformylase
MSVRPIVRLGHPDLRLPARPLAAEFLAEPEFQNLVEDLFETMREFDGMGLAAPQVDVGWQVFVYELAASGPRVVVNPMLTPEAGELVEEWEGCLSIPGLRGLVPRHPAVRVHGVGRHGEPLDYRVEGLEARVIQHEYDHLHGVLYLDRMRDLHSLGFTEELDRLLEGDDEPDSATALG